MSFENFNIAALAEVAKPALNLNFNFGEILLSQHDLASLVFSVGAIVGIGGGLACAMDREDIGFAPGVGGAMLAALGGVALIAN